MTRENEAGTLAESAPCERPLRRDMLLKVVPWAVGAVGSLFAGCSDEPSSAPPAAAAASGAGSSALSTPQASSTRVMCATATTFEPIVDDYARASFLKTAESTTLDWLTIGFAMSQRLNTLPERVFHLLRGLADLQLGYPIDLFAHSLQTATRARRAGAPDELVLCALCHRIGMAFTTEGYAELSAALLRGYVSDDAYRVVLHHPEYLGNIEQRSRYVAQPWHADAVRFSDEWQSASYDGSYDSLPLSSFEPLVINALGGTLHDPYQTRNDCV